MLTVFAYILAFLKVIPIVDGWVRDFIVYYSNSAIDRMTTENRAAIKKAIDGQDQRDLEKALGNPNAGEPSNIAGTELRDTLPGVSNPPGH